MSGGHFNYQDSSLKSEIFGWGDEVTNQFEDLEISELVWDVLDLIHEYDWYVCGDTGEDDYLEAKAKFKKKWFGDSRENQIKTIVDKAIDNLRTELYKTFDVKPVAMYGCPLGKVEDEIEIQEAIETLARNIK